MVTKVQTLMRILIAAAIIALGVIGLRADYLYWTVNSSSYDGVDYNGAILWGGTGDNYSMASDIEQIPDSFLTPVTAGYSYYIELVNYNAVSGGYSSVAKSETLTYTGQASGFFVTSLDYDIPPIAWSGGRYSGAVPEPSAALLVMFGVALLGLKRRNGFVVNA